MLRIFITDARRSLYWIAYARDPGKAAWVWGLTLIGGLINELWPCYRDAIVRGLEIEAEEWGMALKGFIWAWVTVLAGMAGWVAGAMYVMGTYPWLADAMNYGLAGVVLWWAWRVERGDADDR